MSEFRCEVIVGPNTVQWTMVGAISETISFPEVDTKKKLIIDLKNVTSINSYGVKIWCQWMNKNKGISNIELVNCPYTIVYNLSLVSSFTNDITTITSFYVPFINEETDESAQVLFTLGKDYQQDGFITMPIVKDSKGNAMELDVNPSTYFSFLKKKSKT